MKRLFETGDVVALRSGGTTMTIEGYCEECPWNHSKVEFYKDRLYVQCRFFHGGKFYTEHFDQDTLRKY